VTPAASPRPALFLDRDGVLIVDVGYPHRPEHLRWMPGAQAAVRRANEAGWWVFVVTNQSGVARGFFDLEAVHRFHALMDAQLAEAGAWVDAWYVSPHHPDAIRPEWRHPDPPDRKPNPGMLLRAMADHPVDAARSAMIGDKPSDMEAARRAGVKGVLYGEGDLDSLVAELIGR
jgi:D-glycero-D-manno-heptose 1,7-bisphosphate phosphatase